MSPLSNYVAHGLVPCLDDPLGLLYARDSSLDAMYARGAVDEDEAQEAYEHIIRVVSSPSEGVADAVLSLAAQLLTKHFHKFPHVNANVVDVLLALSSAPHSQAVRIHSVRSLLQIVKGPAGAETSLTPECREKMAAAAQALLKGESSTVVVRHLAQLEAALAAFDLEKKRMEEAEKEKEEQKQQAEEKRKLMEEKKKEAEEKRVERERRQQEQQQDEERKREEREKKFQEKKVELEEKRKEREKRFELNKRDQGIGEDKASASSNRGATGKENGNRKMRHEKSVKCPPSPYIFVGGVPRGTQPIDVVNFLAAVDGSLSTKSVQIKFPPDGRSAGFAFVNLQSVDLARQCVYHVHTTEFKGRNLIGDFARGPPCSTLQFLERDPNVPMQKVEAVSNVDLQALDKSILDELYKALDRFGPFEVLDGARVRFRNIEGAKSVTRKLTFEVQGRIFLPVYDTDAQSEGDSSQRNEARKDTKTDGSSQRKGVERRDSRELRVSDVNGRGRKRLRSRSPENESREQQRRREKTIESAVGRGANHREFDQARYGPPLSARDSRDRRDRSNSPSARKSDVRIDHRAIHQEKVDSRARMTVQSEASLLERDSRRKTDSRLERNRSSSPPARSHEDRRLGTTASPKPVQRRPTPPDTEEKPFGPTSAPHVRESTRRSRSPPRQHRDNGDRYGPGRVHSARAERSKVSGQTKPSDSGNQTGQRISTDRSPREPDRGAHQRHPRRDPDQPAKTSHIDTLRSNGRSSPPEPRPPARVRSDSRDLNRSRSVGEPRRQENLSRKRYHDGSAGIDDRDKRSDPPRVSSPQHQDDPNPVESKVKTRRGRSRSPQARNDSQQRGHTPTGRQQERLKEKMGQSPTTSKARDNADSAHRRSQALKRRRSQSPQQRCEDGPTGASHRPGKDGNRTPRASAKHNEESEHRNSKRKDTRPGRDREEDRHGSKNKADHAETGDDRRLGEPKASSLGSESRSRQHDPASKTPKEEISKRSKRDVQKAEENAVDETQAKIDRPSHSPPLGEEKKPLTVTPTGSPRKKSTSAKVESPPPSVFKSTSASIYDDIDECMVDYEEDDD